MHKHLQKWWWNLATCFTGRILLLPMGCISLLPIGRIYRYWREQGYHPWHNPWGKELQK